MDWPNIALQQVLALSDSGVWGPEDAEAGTSVLRSTNFRNNGSLDMSKLSRRRIPQKSREEKLLCAGDIILERSGGSPAQPVGRVCYFSGDYEPHSFGNFCQRLRPHRWAAEPRYLFWYLHQFHHSGGTLALQKQTTGIRNLDFAGYLRQRVPLPPPSEQRRIVDILDQADRLRCLRADADVTAERILPTLLARALGGAWSWESHPRSRALGDLVDPVSGATPAKNNGDYWIGAVPWVSPKDMKSDFLFDAQDHVSQLAVDDTNLKIVEPGSVLIVVRGMILARDVPVALNMIPVTINQDMKALVPKTPTVSGAYVWATLRLARPSLHSLVRTAGHGTRKLDTPELLQFRVVEPVPAQLAQVDSIVRQHRLYSVQREKAAANIAHLFVVLLSRAFSGSLTASWRVANMDLLLQEMEEQAKVLRAGTRSE